MRLTRFFRKGFIFFTSVFLVLAIILTVNRTGRDKEVERELQKLRDAGYPTNAAELDAWYKIDSSVENPASEILNAISLMSKSPVKSTNLLVLGRAELPEFDQPISNDQMTALRQFLTTNEETLKELKRILNTRPESVRYPVDLSLGFNNLLPHLSQLKSAAQLFKMDSIYQLETKNNQEAIDSVVQSLTLARTLEKEPILISQLVRIAMQSIASSTAELVLNRGSGLTVEQLEQMKQAFTEGVDSDAVSRSLVGECAMGLDFFVNSPDPKEWNSVVGNNGSNPMVTGAAMSLYRASGFLQNDTLFYMRHMSQFAAGTEQSHQERFKTAQEAEAEVGRMRSEFSSKLMLISKMLLPALGKAVGKDLGVIATMEATRTALAVEQYRLKHNDQVPANLEDLVPDFLESIPEDPFSGSPVKYRKRERGFVIYSVGADLKDNQGLSRTEAQKLKTGLPGNDREYDVGFSIKW